MTSNLEWLEQIVKARTPGPWKMDAFPDFSRGGLTKFIVDYNTLNTNDASFIALMGTISEQLVAVVRAVKYWEDYYAIELAHYKNGETQVLCDAMAKLDTAIAAARNGMDTK